MNNTNTATVETVSVGSLPEGYYTKDEVDVLIAGAITAGFYYEHDQPDAATQWDVIHNLGNKPNVTIIDSDGNNIMADIQHLDNNNLRITFVETTAGKAILS